LFLGGYRGAAKTTYEPSGLRAMRISRPDRPDHLARRSVDRRAVFEA